MCLAGLLAEPGLPPPSPENSLPSSGNCPVGVAGIWVRKQQKSLSVRELVPGEFVSLVLLIGGLFIYQGSGDDSSLNMEFSSASTNQL